MRSIKVFLIIICTCSFNLIYAQLMEGPEISSDRRVSLRINAPEAYEVKVINLSDSAALGAKEYDMHKNSHGVWEITTKPCRPGLHYYELSIDGARVSDPESPAYFGWGKWTSCVEIPDPSLNFYLPREVPHGDVRTHWYFSKTTQSFRKCLVYLPPGYDQHSSTRYPVLYLQHGAGESELGWTMQGKANFILDNLIAENKARPMIIVMDNGYAPAPEAENLVRPRGADNRFENLVTNELVPMIDQEFRTLADPANRAIAGLSMGAGQALTIGLAHPEMFASIGAFSGGAWGGNFNPDTSFNGIFKDAKKFNHDHRLLFIGCGTLDGGYERLKVMHNKLDQHGIPNIWSEPYGSHEWQVWRKHLHEFAQLLFKQ